MTKREFLSHHTAKRNSKHMRAFDIERIEQRRGIIRHIGDREWLLRLLGSANASVVE
jgi:hypothetical protein